MSELFADLPRAHFRAILADPPWTFAAGTKGRPQHYDRMTDRQLARLPVEDLAHAEGCWLFLWTTSPKLHHAHAVAEAWGFRYSARAFVWIKTGRHVAPLLVAGEHLPKGMGFTTRKNAEDVLLYRRGAPKRLCTDVHEVILSPLREHSRKPPETKERMERFCAGPYLEMFSRENRDGWTAWGNQTGKFDERRFPEAAE